MNPLDIAQDIAGLFSATQAAGTEVSRCLSVLDDRDMARSLPDRCKTVAAILTALGATLESSHASPGIRRETWTLDGEPWFVTYTVDGVSMEDEWI